MDSPELVLAQQIKKLRAKRGLTQDELAEAAGVHRATMYRIESGKFSLSLRTMKALADALEVQVRDLVKNIR